MTQITFTAVILTESGKVIQKQIGFKKKWKAEKWASRQIDKNHKLDEWFFKVYMVYNECQ
jgi:hypothetical protein